MIKPKIALVCLLLMFCFPALALGEVTFPEMEGFTIDTEYDTYDSETLWEYINGASEVFLMYEFDELRIADYIKGDDSINVEIYVHRTPEMAFGMYTKERQPTYNFVDIGVQGHLSETQIYFVKGRNYVKIMTSSPSDEIRNSLRSLAERIASSLEGTSEMPEIIRSLPVEGRKVNGEVFLTESVMGHPFLKDAYKMNYSLNGKSFDVFVFTTKSTEERREMLEAYLEWAEVEGIDPSSEEIFLEDKYNGPVYIRQNGPRMILFNGLQKDSLDLTGSIADAVLGK